MGPLIGHRIDLNKVVALRGQGARTQQKLTQVIFTCLVTQCDKWGRITAWQDKKPLPNRLRRILRQPNFSNEQKSAVPSCPRLRFFERIYPFPLVFRIVGICFEVPQMKSVPNFKNTAIKSTYTRQWLVYAWKNKILHYSFSADHFMLDECIVSLAYLENMIIERYKLSHLDAKRSTWNCTAWPSFSFDCRFVYCSLLLLKNQ